MNLDLLLLGLLREPASGYDLGRHFEESLRHFWSTDLPQLYRTLNRLARAGLLSVQTEPSSRGPRRRVYQTTDEGLAHLRAALTSSPTLGLARDPLLAHVSLLGALEDERAALEVLHEVRDLLLAELSRLHSSGSPAGELAGLGGASGDPDEVFAELVREAAIARVTALVSWATRSVHRLEDRLRRAH